MKYVLVILALVFAPTMAHAQTKIAVVDVRMLLSESNAAKSIQEQIKKKRDSFVSDLGDEEKKLRSMEKKLIEQKDDLSQDDFVKKRQSFEKELMETRKDAAEDRRDLEAAAAKASNRLRAEIVKTVQSIVDEEGYDLVLSMQNVVVGSNTLDISGKVLERLNKNVSKIDVKF